MSLIKSHTYTINLANVNYIKSTVDIDNNHGTLFYMNNGKCVTITCPYDVVMHQLAGSRLDGDYTVKVIYLEY